MSRVATPPDTVNPPPNLCDLFRSTPRTEEELQAAADADYELRRARDAVAEGTATLVQRIQLNQHARSPEVRLVRSALMPADDYAREERRIERERQAIRRWLALEARRAPSSATRSTGVVVALPRAPRARAARPASRPAAKPAASASDPESAPPARRTILELLRQGVRP